MRFQMNLKILLGELFFLKTGMFFYLSLTLDLIPQTAPERGVASYIYSMWTHIQLLNLCLDSELIKNSNIIAVEMRGRAKDYRKMEKRKGS